MAVRGTQKGRWGLDSDLTLGFGCSINSQWIGFLIRGAVLWKRLWRRMEVEVEKNGENSGPLMSLSVDHLNCDRLQCCHSCQKFSWSDNVPMKVVLKLHFFQGAFFGYVLPVCAFSVCFNFPKFFEYCTQHETESRYVVLGFTIILYCQNPKLNTS